MLKGRYHNHTVDDVLVPVQAGPRVVICHWPSLPESRLPLVQLLPLVSSERRERAQRCHLAADAWRMVLGELLVRAVWAQEFGHRAARAIRWSPDEFGKPRVYDTADEVMPGSFLNISHAGDWLALVWDEHAEVGVDIEESTRVLKNPMSIAHKYFSQDEAYALELEEENLRSKLFFRIWTLKESVVKCTGGGIAEGLQKFSVMQCLQHHQSHGAVPIALPAYKKQANQVQLSEAERQAAQIGLPAGYQHEDALLYAQSILADQMDPAVSRVGEVPFLAVSAKRQFTKCRVTLWQDTLLF